MLDRVDQTPVLASDDGALTPRSIETDCLFSEGRTSKALAVHPVVEAQIAEAENKATLDEMLDFARGEAARIEMVQRGLIACGARVAPDPGQIRRLVVADALALVIEMFIRHETEARRLFSHLERNRRAAA